MDLLFDLWHLAFATLLQRRAPPNFEVKSEVRLTIEPQRADLLLLRRIGAPQQDHRAKVLRALWARLGRVGILEYKSPVDGAFRPGDLLRLVAYGVLYETAHLKDLPGREDLTLVLVVASVTSTLLEEMAKKGWTLTQLGGGYARIEGVMYTCYLVVIDEVSKSERDEYLRLFSHHLALPGKATRWLQQWMRDTKMKQPDVEKLPEWDDMMKRFLAKLPVEERMEGLTPEEVLGAFAPEQRLAGLAPEQRMEGLAPEQVVLALPLEVLRGFSDDYLRSLPAEVEEQVRRRLLGTPH